MKNKNNNNSKMPVKQIKNSTVFVIYCMFKAFPLYLTSIQKSPYRIPTGLWGLITVFIPVCTHIHGNPAGISIPSPENFVDMFSRFDTI